MSFLLRTQLSNPLEKKNSCPAEKIYRYIGKKYGLFYVGGDCERSSCLCQSDGLWAGKECASTGVNISHSIHFSLFSRCYLFSFYSHMSLFFTIEFCESVPLLSFQTKRKYCITEEFRCRNFSLLLSRRVILFHCTVRT